MDKWIKKTWYIHIMDYYVAIKKNAVMPFGVTQVGPDCHTEGSKSDRERQISYDSAYMQNLKEIVEMNLFTTQK